MKAYKGFNQDLTCRGFQYAEGETYTTDKAELCRTGFHACLEPMDVFSYYHPSNGAVVHEVEVDDDVKPDPGGDSKVASRRITIGAQLDLMGMIKVHLGIVWDKVAKVRAAMPEQASSGDRSTAASSGDRSTAASSGDRSTAASSGYRSTAASSGYQSTAASSGYQSTAASSGDQSTAASSGYQSTAASSGYQSTAASSGYQSTAASSGDQSTAASSGDQSTAASSGYRSTAASSGYQSTAASSGDQSTAASSGDQSTAASSGDRSTAASSGYRSTAAVSGPHSVAVAAGFEGKAKGAEGCVLLLIERAPWQEEGRILAHKSVMVGRKCQGRMIKPDTWYQLVNGRVVEA